MRVLYGLAIGCDTSILRDITIFDILDNVGAILAIIGILEVPPVLLPCVRNGRRAPRPAFDLCQAAKHGVHYTGAVINIWWHT